MELDIKVTVSPLPLFAKSGKGRIPFEKIAREILGLRYQLSLVVCGDSLATKMNRKYRKRSYAANVLSFHLERYEGELFLNVRKAEREARQLGISVRKRLIHLFVHGCLHLAGLKHGTSMDALEKKMIGRFA